MYSGGTESGKSNFIRVQKDVFVLIYFRRRLVYVDSLITVVYTLLNSHQPSKHSPTQQLVSSADTYNEYCYTDNWGCFQDGQSSPCSLPFIRRAPSLVVINRNLSPNFKLLRTQKLIPRNEFCQAVQPGGPVRQPYFYSVPAPVYSRLFKNSTVLTICTRRWVEN